MNAVKDNSTKEEDNYYKILEVRNTATLTEIRNAYEEKLEEAHLEAIAAYSLFPEEETEEKLYVIVFIFCEFKFFSTKSIIGGLPLYPEEPPKKAIDN